VAIVARGKIVRQGTLEEIRSGLVLESEIRVRASRPLNREAILKLPGVESAKTENGTALLRVNNPAQALTHLLRYLDSQDSELVDVAVSHPTLEDVFLKVTGERLAGEED
jgi:ABC-2 type transport system ATP-binding protein